MTTHEKLVLARNTLARRGLATGGYADSAGRVCTYGALLRHCPEGPTMLQVEQNRDFVKALGFNRLSDLFEWNDASTLEEVLARMDEAIARTAPSPVDCELPFEAETWGTPIEHEPERVPVVPPNCAVSLSAKS